MEMSVPSGKILKLSPLTELAERLEATLQARGMKYICGVDEAGRGPLAGPVVAAAVVLSPEIEIEGLADSKKLSPARRDEIFKRIIDLGLPCAVGIIDHKTIDMINILQASLRAMRKAVMDLDTNPDVVLVDGNVAIPHLSPPQIVVVAGDQHCRAISAASVIAKVTRDRIMERYQELYPAFSFAAHKGYPTAEHLDELRRHGPCDIHRLTFRPVAELVNQYALF